MTAGEDDGVFGVEATAVDGVVTVRASGDFDLAAGAVWESTVPPLLANGPRQVDIDLAGVTFIDSSGLGRLVKLRQVAESTGVKLRLLDVPHRVARVLDYSGVTALFELSATEFEPD